MTEPTPPRGEQRACERCGIIRHWRTGRGNLCSDCRYVLTTVELEAWVA